MDRYSRVVKSTAPYVVLVFVFFLLGRLSESSEDRPDEVADLVLATTLFAPLLVAHALAAWQALPGRTLQSLGLVWRGVLAGALAGFGLGIGLRIGMRGVAVLAGQPPVLTVGGTLFVMGVGVFFGASYGSLFPVLRQWLSGRLHGLVYGTLLAAFFWSSFFDAAARDLRGVVGDPALIVLTTLVSTLWIAYGAGLGWVLGRWKEPVRVVQGSETISAEP